MRFSLAKLLLCATAACAYLGFVVAANPLVGLLGLSFTTLLLPGLYAGLWFAAEGPSRAFLLGCSVSTAPLLLVAVWGLYFSFYEIGPELNWNFSDSDVPVCKAVLMAGHLIILLGGLSSLALWHRTQ